jgi:pimeloyl-ACP methyl ester carboxylesterase
MQISHEFRLGQTALRMPEALVVLLHDETYSSAQMNLVAERWAISLPETAFEVFETSDLGVVRSDPAADLAGGGLDGEFESGMHDLEPILQSLLRMRRLDPSRLVLIGFGTAGSLALQVALRLSWKCAGVLAIGASLGLPLPQLMRIDQKIRLIQCASGEQGGFAGLRDEVASLAQRGVDARGAAVTGSALSDEAVRHAGAYLVELVANAQRGAPLRLYVENWR